MQERKTLHASSGHRGRFSYRDHRGRQDCESAKNILNISNATLMIPHHPPWTENDARLTCSFYIHFAQLHANHARLSKAHLRFWTIVCLVVQISSHVGLARFCCSETRDGAASRFAIAFHFRNLPTYGKQLNYGSEATFTGRTFFVVTWAAVRRASCSP
jgi:hypothetical protein